MRFCFVTPEFLTEPFFSGGLANYLGRVTVALAEMGHDVHVITRSSQNGELDYRGVKVHRVVPLWDKRMILDHADPLVPKVFYNAYQDWKAAWCIWKRWQQLRRSAPFDVVQVANVTSVGLWFRFERKVPVVMRMSSSQLEWDTHVGAPIDAGVRARWKMQHLSIRGVPYIYAPSHFVARAVEKYHHIKKVDVVEPPFFLEEVQYDPSEYEARFQNKKYALFFGRMTKMKGVHVLAQALPEVFRQCPDLEMVFVGPDATGPDGDGSMQKYVESVTSEFAHRVHFTGPLRHDKLYPILQNAHFVTLPSFIDNLPNTCLEAMGMGRVVLATTGTCFEQLIEPGISGFLVPIDDVPAQIQGMIEASQLSDEQRRAMGEKAKARIDELHPDKAVPRLLDYYKMVIAKSQGKSVAKGASCL